jgi:hypothetical protein
MYYSIHIVKLNSRLRSDHKCREAFICLCWFQPSGSCSKSFVPQINMEFKKTVTLVYIRWWICDWFIIHVCNMSSSPIILSEYCFTRFLYDGGNVVPRSIDLGQPVVFVSMNYR